MRCDRASPLIRRRRRTRERKKTVRTTTMGGEKRLEYPSGRWSAMKRSIALVHGRTDCNDRFGASKRCRNHRGPYHMFDNIIVLRARQLLPAVLLCSVFIIFPDRRVRLPATTSRTTTSVLIILGTSWDEEGGGGWEKNEKSLPKKNKRIKPIATAWCSCEPPGACSGKYYIM